MGGWVGGLTLTGNLREPQSTECSRMWGRPVESAGGVRKVIPKTLFWEIGWVVGWVEVDRWVGGWVEEGEDMYLVVVVHAHAHHLGLGLLVPVQGHLDG